MSDHSCANCRYYLQHYTFDKRKIFRVYCGHCTFHRPKTKKPDAAACEKFIPGLPQENAFANKEYLSKELIQHMISLDLLPEIGESEDLDPQRK